MHSLIRRIERLEQLKIQKDPTTVFLYRWIGDKPIGKASCNDENLIREEGESEDAFVNRSAQWAHTLPGENWGRCVWLTD